ncbi:MAG: hypothetical protein ED556_05465 [Winogradskyella sp.]|uniref:glycosyltransferase n=1 Tax=Winogradskyella sp. TaxID=1883156 RepID=UPI000F3B9CF4|nr:glycosyltransferase [Winogradskyella sp.]RNC86872.1 MAG: hypothetical protein ED556_05465 [Winogradskyella sp.]
MKTFSHYIITRFNIKSQGWTKDKNGNTVNDLAWLKHRYNLFDMFCLPSMVSQSEKNYQWLVFFDKETPEEFRRKNEKISKQLKQFKPFYVDGFLDFENSLRAYITKDSKSDYVLTTRFDNDDCFHENALKVIQQSFSPKHNTVIELANGLTMQISSETKLAKRNNVFSGPFITLVEKTQDSIELQTVYDCEHTEWENRAEFTTIDNGYYWLQTIHDANITNRLYQDLTFNKKFLGGFHFNYKPKFKLSYIVFVIFKNLGVFKIKRRFSIN